LPRRASIGVKEFTFEYLEKCFYFAFATARGKNAAGGVLAENRLLFEPVKYKLMAKVRA